ncbi:hypothetical protein J3R30DRAFT_3501045 [Lentinula aciculospora]|uniref:Uncharacterized protein n=1 Tax=Lentinula aciculospora TaxID=153920 RepID=A0A9W9A6F1_9AGAR|nr:hypothetical protein J3R30DRAFT_3501045 [Lentinula aciculospora]
MEHPYLRTVLVQPGSRRRGRPPKLPPLPYAKQTSQRVTSLLADTMCQERPRIDDDESTQPLDIDDELKKTFSIVYKKHGSLKERRDLNIKYQHIACEQCITRNKTCEIRATALQCGNCPPYVKCTRVPSLKMLRVLDIMDITEEQYGWLLAWYKKTAEEELLEPLRESLQLASASAGPSYSPNNSTVSPERDTPHSSLTSTIVSQTLPMAYRNEDPTHLQNNERNNSTNYGTVNVVPQDHQNNEYSSPRKYYSYPATHILAQPLPIPYARNEQRLGDRSLSQVQVAPYHTPPSPYRSPSPCLLAPTAPYRIPSDECSCSECVDLYAQSYTIPGQQTRITWNRHNDETHSHLTMGQPSSLSSIVHSGEMPHHEINFEMNCQGCANGECGHTRQSEDSSALLHYSYPERTGYLHQPFHDDIRRPYSG